MTGNMQRHVKLCWNENAAKVTDDAKDVQDVYKHIMEAIL